MEERKMKKKVTALLLAGMMAAGTLLGCGSGSDTKEVNTSTASFDEMVSYLTEEGYIDKDCTPVNINETEGYLTDNTGGEWTDLVVADEAEDYDGLWLFYWNGQDKSDLYTEVYEQIAVNGNIILLGGGAALIQLDGFSGYFGIAFSDDYAQKDEALSAFEALPSNE